MNKVIFSLVFIIVISCDFKNDGAIYNIDCDNLPEMYVEHYPKEIDSLIQIELNEIYKKDSIYFEIMGHVTNDLNLKNCKIDKSVYNAQVRVKVDSKYDYWRISYKKIDGKLKEQIFFKRKG